MSKGYYGQRFVPQKMNQWDIWHLSLNGIVVRKIGFTVQWAGDALDSRPHSSGAARSGKRQQMKSRSLRSLVAAAEHELLE